ncbi:EAL domain-containing protein [Pleomorphomonas sp. PLEO]|uniref:EAL domain-containing protein n=1 Tax=Pleomorphomonas sp. PLEO TaxID=3239306 RepID=UPI00351EF9C7
MADDERDGSDSDMAYRDGGDTPDPKQAASSKPRKPPGPINEDLYYVGIGASAGGLEALRPFVANLPPQADMTYIIAQHMSPDHKSLMVELLARETQLPVQEATNNLIPRRDTIYVAPPNADITVINGRFHISRPTNTIGPKPSVDRFFMSLADDRRDHAIGIVLSGTGSDGAHGVKAIKAAGGISIAQDPKTAKYDSMPRAAIRVGGADLVLSPKDVANKLTSIVQWPHRSPPTDDDESDPPPPTVQGIIQQIASHTGMDFANYKDATISRQIMRRMAALQIPTVEAYGKHVSNQRDELATLASNFLICVTSFFRDPDAFHMVRKFLRDLLKKKRPGDEIRIWIPGCATGEEVYSVAIILDEELGEARDKYRVQIFATDINDEAVAVARAGVYPEAALAGIDADTIGRYFSERDGMYVIHKWLRDRVLFARQDLVQDPPFLRMDMVSCRNLLIYFKADLQDRVLKLFHYALRDNGILFLGKSESVARLGGLFIELDRKGKVYLKRPIATPMIAGFARTRGSTGMPGDTMLPVGKEVAQLNSTLVGRDRLFDIYAPPSILMTAAGEIVEIFGDCSAFLAVRTGRADFNAFSLIIPTARPELRAFAYRVSRDKQTVVSSAFEVLIDGKSEYMRLAVHYCGESDAEEAALLLVSFEKAEGRQPIAQDVTTPDLEAVERVKQLEHELILNREYLQTVIEELETANEELQATNEEAQSANEELQASNEELETANEELQASNEELTTVNDELGSRTSELTEACGDLANVLDSLDHGIIVVDQQLDITRYNSIARIFFKLPLDSFPNFTLALTGVPVAELLPRIHSVLLKQKMEEFEFRHENRRIYLFRLVPYIDVNRGAKAQSVVVCIHDITEKKEAEDKILLSASVFENALEGTVVTDANNNILSVNPAFTRITGYSEAEVIGRNPRVLSAGEQSPEFYRTMWDSISRTGVWKGELTNRRKDGEIYPEWLSICAVKSEDGRVVRYIAVFSDLTDEKKALLTIQRQANFDALTNLPNRSLTSDRLQQMLVSSRHNNRMFAVLFIDLDHFKDVNDALGHNVGDVLLIKTGDRIAENLRDTDTVGRLGGDEFIVLLNDLNGIDDIVPVVRGILSAIAQPLSAAGHAVQTSASIGITVYPMDGDTPEALLKNADSAMYEAKRHGRNTYCFFTQQMQDEANRRHWISTEMAAAIQSRQMQLYFQPIIRIADQQLIGAEALLRWRHPAHGLISPDVFIPIAEQNGSILQIGRWVFEHGLEAWEQYSRGNPGLSLAFNMSAAEFVSREHIEDLLFLLNGSGLATEGKINIEITESVKFSDNADYVETLNRFRRLGCGVAIDDFGTGFSSISYLKKMPIDVVKIDRSFIRDIGHSEGGDAMIRALIQMVLAMSKKCVAEGVETREQFEFLKECGCTYAQGFLFGRAMPLAEFDAQRTVKMLPPAD